MVDKATFPSDTLSTHFIHPPGMAALSAGAWPTRSVATGCPPMTRYKFDFGFFTIAGTPQPVDGIADGLRPAPDLLDTLLVEAAADAGVDVRDGLLGRRDPRSRTARSSGIRGHDDGGNEVTERARVVIGADGRRSLVAKAVQARAVQREAEPCRGLLRLLQRRAVDRVRGVRARPPRLGPVPDATTASR